jgi:hypothetical protein
MHTGIRKMTKKEFLSAMGLLSRKEFFDLLKHHYAYPGIINKVDRSKNNTQTREALHALHCGLVHSNCQFCKLYLSIEKSKSISSKKFDRLWPVAQMFQSEFMKAAIVKKVIKTVLPKLLNEQNFTGMIVARRLANKKERKKGNKVMQ